MASYRYETHKMPDPLLPFIFHRQFILSRRELVPNWHENIEILQAVEGSGHVACGKAPIAFEEGSLFVINADTLHGIGSDSRLVYRCLIVDKSFLAANGIPQDRVAFQNVIKDRALFACFDRITRAYDTLDREDFCTVLTIRAEVLQLLRLLCLDYRVPRSPAPGNEYVKKAMAILRRDLANTPGLDGLAAQVGISKYHLARLFKEHTGASVVQTLKLMRCTEAQRLIEGGMSVSAAAAACGFENLSYFSRSFKALFGHLPSKLH